MKLLSILLASALSLATFQAEACKEHRSRVVRAAFQRANPCPANHLTKGACPGYLVDHVKPLACGGPDIVSNMQWQTLADARAKDRVERQLCSK